MPFHTEPNIETASWIFWDELLRWTGVGSIKVPGPSPFPMATTNNRNDTIWNWKLVYPSKRTSHLISLTCPDYPGIGHINWELTARFEYLYYIHVFDLQKALQDHQIFHQVSALRNEKWYSVCQNALKCLQPNSFWWEGFYFLGVMFFQGAPQLPTKNLLGLQTFIQVQIWMTHSLYTKTNCNTIMLEQLSYPSPVFWTNFHLPNYPNTFCTASHFYSSSPSCN